MDLVSTGQQNRVHPHRFVLWVAMASIVMMFAGLTSAYLVKSGAANWVEVKEPKVFWLSTLVILLSSVTIQASLRAFKQRNMAQYRRLFLVTLGLGLLFVALQSIGFNSLWKDGVRFEGAGAGQFLYIIFGLHALHVIGGIIAMIYMTGKQYFSKTRSYDPTPVSIMATYWHFVDGLWLYLLIFFIWIG